MTNTKWFIGCVVALVAGVIIGSMFFGGSKMLGSINNGASVINFPEWFTNSTGSGNVVYAGKSQQWAVDDSGKVTSGNITVTTSNTATSTLTVGCVQMYATSTATAEKLTFIASTTAPTNGSGVIPVVSYGSCP